MMKVILDTKENLESIIVAFDNYGVTALTASGREFTAEGYLINLGGSGSVTKTYDIIHEDSEQGFYITHPEEFRDNWGDECADSLIALIPETATINLNFIRTIQEGMI